MYKLHTGLNYRTLFSIEYRRKHRGFDDFYMHQYLIVRVYKRYVALERRS